MTRVGLTARALAITLVMCTNHYSIANAQAAASATTLRSSVDSSYAVGLALAKIADQIRHAEYPNRRGVDTAITTAAVALATAARRANHAAPPRAELGSLWDFRFDSIQVESVGRDSLTVTAVATLATSRAPPKKLRFHFHRVGDSWILEPQGALRVALDSWARSASLGRLP